MITIKDFVSKFEKTPKQQKHVLIGAVIVFILTFFPWMSLEDGGFIISSFSANGWSIFGAPAALASVGLILVWLLPLFGVGSQLSAKISKLQKALAIVMSANFLFWFFLMFFEFIFFYFSNISFWLAMLVSGFTLVIAFKKGQS